MSNWKDYSNEFYLRWIENFKGLNELQDVITHLHIHDPKGDEPYMTCIFMDELIDRGVDLND